MGVRNLNEIASKGHYAIIRAILLDEYRRILSCTSSKQACMRHLGDHHEGTLVVKKIQNFEVE